ncbi:MAG: FG-GAP repeat protein [Planctomycetes bacterium]|nr:FG-GAP repeat protein [Planctomycetota bacterium]
MILALFAGTLPAQDRLLSIRDGRFNVSRVVPDVNGDGYSDLVVGAWQTGGVLEGRVRLYSGRDLRTCWGVMGTGPGAALGYSLASITDLDADGCHEILAGAPFGAGANGGSGYVAVLSGRTGTRLTTLSGPARSRYFGSATTVVSDLDGDGLEDIIVGAPMTSAGALETGEVYALSSKAGKVLYSVVGTGFRPKLGTSVARLGDVDGDGIDDYVAGSPDESGTLLGSGSVTVISGRSGTVLYKLWGSTVNGHFHAVAGLGDLDGDGCHDFIVGADETTTLRNPGYAQVYSGRSGRLLYRVVGDGAGDQFGLTVSSLGDIDGDRIPDFAVGAPQGGAILPAGGGYVRLFSGKSGKVLSTIRAQPGESWFGVSIGGGGHDFDQDGSPDLVISGVQFKDTLMSEHIYSTRPVQLLTDTYTLPLGQGGTQTLTLDAGTAHANRAYWLLGSVTGTRVGIQLGGLRLPLDFDAYTRALLAVPNPPFLPAARGALDASGRATVQFVLPPAVSDIPPFTLHHAFLVFDSSGPVLASNPAWLRLQ